MVATDSSLDSAEMARARSLLTPRTPRDRLWPVLAAAALLAFSALVFATAMILAPALLVEPSAQDRAVE